MEKQVTGQEPAGLKNGKVEILTKAAFSTTPQSFYYERCFKGLVSEDCAALLL